MQDVVRDALRNLFQQIQIKDAVKQTFAEQMPLYIAEMQKQQASGDAQVSKWSGEIETAKIEKHQSKAA